MISKELPEPATAVTDAAMENPVSAADEDGAAQREKVLQQKQYVTGRIGDSCRFIGFGLLAVFYAINTSNEAFAKNIVASQELLLWSTGAFGALTILADYLQYVLGSFAVNAALRNKTGRYKYDDSSFSYRGREVFYHAKQLTAFLGAMALVGLVAL